MTLWKLFEDAREVGHDLVHGDQRVPPLPRRRHGFRVEAQPAQAHGGDVHQVGQRLAGPAERTAVAVPRVVADIREVQVGVQLHHMQFRHVVERPQQRVTHGMVAAQEHGHAAAFTHLPGCCRGAFPHQFRFQAGQHHVPGVGEGHALEAGCTVQSGEGRYTPQARFPQGTRREPRPRPEAQRDIERHAQHCHIRAPLPVRSVHGGAGEGRNARERKVGG